MKRTGFAAVALVALVGLAPRHAIAGDGCDRCGMECGTRKICRLVCETKEIEEICYGCECEDYCLPGRSCRGCLNSDDVCDKGCDRERREHRPVCELEWFTWKPGCATLHCRKNLVKYVVVKEVPSYKWVVEAICCGCGHCLSRREAAPGSSPDYEVVADSEEEAASPLAQQPFEHDDAPRPRNLLGVLFGR